MGVTRDSVRLWLDALYLAVLTARGIKPLSRVEYEVPASLHDAWRRLGLQCAPCERTAADGTRVRHWLLAADPDFLSGYLGLFDGRLLGPDTPDTVRTEARFYGYPVCCAEAYAVAPQMPSGLPPEDQALLFHRACVGCRVSPGLLPAYRAALIEAERLCATLVPTQGASQASRCSRTKASSRR